MPQSEVVVVETADMMELELARNLLQEEGIPFRVESGAASSLLTVTLGQQFGGFHQLLVPADLEERALLALERAWPEPRESDGGPQRK
jgi:hypothetical protein